MTVFRLDSSYLVFRILRILSVELITLLDSRHFSTCELIKYYSGLTVLSVIYVKLQLVKYTIGAKHLSYGTSPPIMAFSENLISSTSAVSRSKPKILSYVQLVNSST